jgi:ribosome-associated toxin RatA of RatAB toxin-antitoxin module
VTRRVQRSALVAAPAALMFELIDRVEDYPQFLPWCVATRLTERRDDLVGATVTVGWKHLRIEVTTRNPKRAPQRMEIHLEGGTFRHFLGLWELRPLGERGCKVDFTLEYELALPGADRVAGHLIDHAADRMVDAFVARAEEHFRSACTATAPSAPQPSSSQEPPSATTLAASPAASPALHAAALGATAAAATAPPAVPDSASTANLAPAATSASTFPPESR